MALDSWQQGWRLTRGRGSVAVLRLRRGSALATEGLVINGLGLIGAVLLYWAAHAGRIRVHI